MFKRIYIVDDSETKRERVRDYLMELYPNAEIVELDILNKGLYRICRVDKEEIKNNPSDYLIVSDMIMPRMEDTALIADAGYGLLAELNRCRISSPAIIVSSDVVDDNRANDAYKYYLGSVKESGSVFCLPLFEEVLKDYLQ